ncbi:MAG: galactokinase [Sanguibacteroides justesenii]|jgi:galactokinase|uniref:galactokinase n=1 Tax=Butyricimonas faecalis TaxID=2093856 RepID=UPI001E139859|nr:galactokinase [Sanguibacteroides justesenii]
MDTGVLEKRFEEIYGTKVEHLYFAPGRVNLIGEHIDYNGGRVFPCALSFGTYLAVALRDDQKIAFASMNQAFRLECDPTIFEHKPAEWVKYPLGVVKEFADRGFDPWGFDILYFGDIPNGAGLSSSASIEVVTAFMLNDLLHAGLDVVELVKMSQRAENLFVGMNCGIMDQFAVGMGKKEHAIALDCGTLDYDLIPLHLNGYKLVITNSNKNHDLVTSEYNVRRSQCEQALADINQALNVKHLCDLSEEELERARHLISDETVYRRARHAVTENARVNEAIDVLQKGDLVRFGELMNESHRSLKEDYEVTGVEMDTLAEEGQKLPGVLGSRITGGGFGGCTVSLVKEDNVQEFIEKLASVYHDKVGLNAEFYVADIGDGVRKIY